MPTLLNINNYHYRRGGADVVYLEQTDLFRRHGWDVVPFAMRHPQNLASQWSQYFPDEIEYGRKYGAVKTARSAFESIYSLEAAKKIKSLVAVTRPSVAHAHNIYSHLSPSILSALSDVGVPVVLTLHDLKLLCPARVMLRDDRICEACKGGRLANVVRYRCAKGSLALSGLVLAEAVTHRVLRTYEKNVARFIAPSRFLLRKFEEWGWDITRFTYVPNFVDSGAYDPDFSPGSYFLYLGRLSPEKGVATLLRAAARAKVSVRIAGTGPQEPQLRALAESISCDATFEGFTTGTALWNLIRRARAVVLPSELYENAPISILEAYCLGKPVIGTRLGGIPELVRIGETGQLFDAGDIDGLAAILQDTAGAPAAVLESWGRTGREWVERDFSAAAYFQRVSSIYESVQREGR